MSGKRLSVRQLLALGLTVLSLVAIFLPWMGIYLYNFIGNFSLSGLTRLTELFPYDMDELMPFLVGAWVVIVFSLISAVVAVCKILVDEKGGLVFHLIVWAIGWAATVMARSMIEQYASGYMWIRIQFAPWFAMILTAAALVILCLPDRLFEGRALAWPVEGGYAPAYGWTCPNCGAAPDDSLRFCPQCGTKRPQEQPERFCSGCGSVLPEGVQFCLHCGSTAAEDSSAPAVYETESSVVTPVYSRNLQGPDDADI